MKIELKTKIKRRPQPAHTWCWFQNGQPLLRTMGWRKKDAKRAMRWQLAEWRRANKAPASLSSESTLVDAVRMADFRAAGIDLFEVEVAVTRGGPFYAWGCDEADGSSRVLSHTAAYTRAESNEKLLFNSLRHTLEEHRENGAFPCRVNVTIKVDRK